MARQIPDGLLVIFFAAFLFSLAGDGLSIYLSRDDMMNLYWAWETPLPSLLAANLVPFTTVYRPLGAVVYRTVFAFAGLDPFPFRCLTYIDVGILGANVPDLEFAKEYGYDYVFDYQDGELVLVGNSVLEERLNRLALTVGARQ